MTTSTPPAAHVELQVGGMTCASCAARIEKKLNRIDGVSATVNCATEKAKVSYPDGVTPQDLIATVEKVGYTAELPPPPASPVPSTRPTGAVDELATLRTRLLVSAVLTVPVLALSMVPAWQFT